MNSDNSNNNNNTNNNNDNNINDNNDNDVDLEQFYIELNKKHKELDKRIRKARNQRANKTLVKKQKTDVIQKTKYEEKKKSQKEKYHRLKSYVAYLRRLDDLNDDQKEILRTYDRIMDLKKSERKRATRKKNLPENHQRNQRISPIPSTLTMRIQTHKLKTITKTPDQITHSKTKNKKKWTKIMQTKQNREKER